MSKKIVLNFESPLQSWAGYHVDKTVIDTDRQPSKRAITGMLAAAFGVHRDSELPEVLKNVEVDVKIVRQGRVVRDFQTIGSQNTDRLNGLPNDPEFFSRIGTILKRGKVLRSQDSPVSSPMISNRTYLADAQFLVSISSDNDESTETILRRLSNPKWDLYLGRKSFAPTFPFILGEFDELDAFRQAENVLEQVKFKLNNIQNREKTENV